jgi:hypothetical protein
MEKSQSGEDSAAIICLSSGMTVRRAFVFRAVLAPFAFEERKAGKPTDKGIGS